MISARTLVLGCMLSAAFAIACRAEDRDIDVAINPAPRDQEKWWMERHEKINAGAEEGGVELLFVGDSITQGWEGAGRDVWSEFYADRHALNAGVSGDCTQHVLWRLDHGNADGIHPRAAVVMIGTNNTRDHHTPEQIAVGVTMVVERLRAKLPEAKILLLAIFPRGATPDDPQRKNNGRANAMIREIADGDTVHWLDIGEAFLDDDGTLPKAVMPDLLHPNTKGYEIWAEAMEPKLAELLGEQS